MLIYGSSLLILLATVAAYLVSRRELARAQSLLEQSPRSRDLRMQRQTRKTARKTLRNRLEKGGKLRN